MESEILATWATQVDKNNCLWRLGILIPVAIQDGCIQIAFIIITMIANHRGLAVPAGSVLSVVICAAAFVYLKKRGKLG